MLWPVKIENPQVSQGPSATGPGLVRYRKTVFVGDDQVGNFAL